MLKAVACVNTDRYMGQRRAGVSARRAPASASVMTSFIGKVACDGGRRTPTDNGIIYGESVVLGVTAHNSSERRTVNDNQVFGASLYARWVVLTRGTVARQPYERQRCVY